MSVRAKKFAINMVFVLAFLIINAPDVTAAETIKVFIYGLEGDVLSNVEAALHVPEGMVKDGRVNRAWLEYFTDRADEKIRKAMQPFGYYDPRLDVFLEESEGRYSMIVWVFPGGPVRVEQVDVSISGPGSEEKSLSGLASRFPLRNGDVLVHQEYENWKGLLKAQAHELGYLDADFTVSRVLVSRQERSARIELSFETGPVYYFGHTRFEGGLEYPEKFLRRHLAFSEGDRFSHSRLAEMQRNILNSERFRESIVIPLRDEAEGHRVPVAIELKSAPPKRLRAGIGYGTDTGARLSTEYRELNALGKGHEFNAWINAAQRRQSGGLGYSIPGAKDIETVTSAQMSLQHESVDTYETEVLSLEVSRTQSLGKGRLGTVDTKLQYERSDIAPEEVTSFLLMPGARLSYHRYDNPIRPAKGSSYAFELRGTSKYLGSDISFIRLMAEAGIILPLPWRLSVLARAKAAVSLQDEPLQDLPASLRLFAGGDRSVRGYKYQSLGPKDESGCHGGQASVGWKCGDRACAHGKMGPGDILRRRQCFQCVVRLDAFSGSRPGPAILYGGRRPEAGHRPSGWGG